MRLQHSIFHLLKYQFFGSTVVMETTSPAPDIISLDDFRQVEMRAGTIVEVSRVPRTEKLYKIIVSLGPYGRKQAITGLVGHYTEQDLLNKRIIFLCNLKEAKFAGQVSQGMLLAASEGDKLAILTTDREIPEGSRVT